MLDYKYPRFSEIERFLELKREDIIEQSEGLFNLEENEVTRCIRKTTSAAQMLKVYMLKEIEIFWCRKQVKIKEIYYITNIYKKSN